MTTLSARALLCDMDGTLVDSHHAVLSAWEAFAIQYGFDFELVKHQSMGKPAPETVEFFLGTGPEAEAGLELVNHLELTIQEGVVPIPGIHKIIEALPEGTWALCTSAVAPLAQSRLRLANIPWPKVAITYDEITNGKPDPETFVTGAARLGVPIEECIVFEDSDAGLIAGQASGATTVRVGWTEGVGDHDVLHIADWSQVRVRVREDGWLDITLGELV